MVRLGLGLGVGWPDESDVGISEIINIAAGRAVESKTESET